MRRLRNSSLFFVAAVVAAPACTQTLMNDPGSTGADQGGDPFDDTQDPGPDGSSPGNSAVFAHSDQDLYRIDPQSLVPTRIGSFNFPTPDQMTDIAIDRSGVMVGISYNTVYSIEPTTAQVTRLSSFDTGLGEGDEMTSLAFVPLEDGSSRERLVSADGRGAVWEIDVNTGARTAIGNYNPPGSSNLGSSGDIVSVVGFGTIATVWLGGETDHLARIDPTTWQASIIGDTYEKNLFGLGFWGGVVYGFNDLGDFVTIDPSNGAVINTRPSSASWWGAGVTTVAPVVVD